MRRRHNILAVVGSFYHGSLIGCYWLLTADTASPPDRDPRQYLHTCLTTLKTFSVCA